MQSPSTLYLSSNHAFPHAWFDTSPLCIYFERDTCRTALDTITTGSQPELVSWSVQQLRKEENIIVELDLNITSQPGLRSRPRLVPLYSRFTSRFDVILSSMMSIQRMRCLTFAHNTRRCMGITTTIQFIVQQQRLKMKNSTQRASFLILHFALTKEIINYVTNWIINNILQRDVCIVVPCA